LPLVPADRLRLGFLGTPVRHKGVAVFEALMDALPGAELHVFEHTAPQFGLTAGALERVVVHDGGATDAVPTALRHVDVVVLPQDAADEGAQYQLPAKMMDALCHGRPVVVTRTAATAGFDWPGVVLVDDWTDRAEVLDAFSALADPRRREALGRTLAERFADECSTEVLGRRLTAAVGLRGA
jgi:hypothetical protein